MKKVAVEKATGHLLKAKQAVARLPKARTFEAFEDAWGDFLTEFGRFLSKLETGAKLDPKSRQWYGGEKRKWRNDPLLSYLFQARNAAEHGLEDVTRRAADAARVRFPSTKEAKLGVWMKVNSDGTVDIKDPKVTTPAGEFTNLEVWNPRVELITVVDERFSGQSWPPPSTHLDAPIADPSPVGLANLAIGQMDALLAEAQKLAK